MKILTNKKKYFTPNKPPYLISGLIKKLMNEIFKPNPISYTYFHCKNRQHVWGTKFLHPLNLDGIKILKQLCHSETTSHFNNSDLKLNSDSKFLPAWAWIVYSNSQSLIFLVLSKHCLITGLHPGKGIVRLFRHCMIITECTYTNRDGTANYTPRSDGIAYCSSATNLHSMLLYWIASATVTQW